MKNKIKKIIDRIEHGNIAYHDAEADLVNLFSITQREQITNFLIYYRGDNLNYEDKNKIDTYIKLTNCL